MTEAETAAAIVALDKRVDAIEKALWWLACLGPCGLVLVIVLAVRILERGG